MVSALIVAGPPSRILEEAIDGRLQLFLAPVSSGPVEPGTGDPDDGLILDCAVAAGVEALVSGDRKHLLPLGEHRGVGIVTPQALLAELRGR